MQARWGVVLETPSWERLRPSWKPLGGVLSLRSQHPDSLQSVPLAQNGPGSLPRTLVATLQDIETKRQLALQQKGEYSRALTPNPIPFTGCFSVMGTLTAGRY